MIYQTLAKVFLICSSDAAKSILSEVVVRRFAAKTESDEQDASHQIRSLLLEAADAIDRANAIVSTLDSGDRALLATPLDEISSALHFELPQKLYLHYPGLAEEGEGWDGTMAEPSGV